MAGLRKFIPLLDRVLVQRVVAETSTKGGILLPESSIGKMSEGTVVSVGPGGRDQNGNTVPISVNVGDKVLLPEYGGTKIEMDKETFVDVILILCLKNDAKLDYRGNVMDCEETNPLQEFVIFRDVEIIGKFED